MDDPTVPTQAAASHFLPLMSGFKSSMCLYGLVKTEGPGDDPGRERVQILCSPCNNGAKAIRAFLSRLDAELMARTLAKEGYRVISLAWFEPGQHIHDHQGWLMMHVCCGFTAQAGRLLSDNGHLMPLGWFIYSETGPWTAKHYVDWGPEMAQLLQNSHAAIGLPNYNAWLNELDSACEAQMRWQVDEAWRALPPLISHESANQRALFDPAERRWRFAATQLEIRKPHPTVQDQGA